MRVVVALHDVTPAFAAPVRQLWAMCAERDVRPALLVVPDWHGAWPLERYPNFVRWLRGRVAEGAEIFLHGERHDEIGAPRRWTDSFRALGRTDSEGEFLTLGVAAARARIERGARRLRALGLDPVGFVAPAWLERGGCSQVVAECGLQFSEDERCVRLHELGMHLPSPVLRWSARGAARAAMSQVVAEARWRLQRNVDLMRIALHPADLARQDTASSIGRELDRWLRVRFPVHYSQI